MLGWVEDSQAGLEGGFGRKVRRVAGQAHLGTLIDTPTPDIACAIECGLPRIPQLTVRTQTAESEGIFRGTGDRFSSETKRTPYWKESSGARRDTPTFSRGEDWYASSTRS